MLAADLATVSVPSQLYTLVSNIFYSSLIIGLETERCAWQCAARGMIAIGMLIYTHPATHLCLPTPSTVTTGLNIDRPIGDMCMAMRSSEDIAKGMLTYVDLAARLHSLTTSIAATRLNIGRAIGGDMLVRWMGYECTSPLILPFILTNLHLLTS